MITGYNHNVNYKGDIFHVQTEDSGRQKAHVITHLYFGGNIVVSRKAQYHDLLGGADEAVDRQIVDLMQKQHKDILRGLLKGTFDVRISERSQGASFLNGPAPLNVDGGCQHRSSFGASGESTDNEALFGEDASGRRLDDVMLDFIRDL